MAFFGRIIAAFTPADTGSVDDSFGSVAETGSAREIRGTIFALLAIFFLVALVSHLPSDVVRIETGTIDQIENFGGIVGALLAHWLLDGLGYVGYSSIGFITLLSYFGFIGRLPTRLFARTIGFSIAAVLSSIVLFLAFSGSFEPSPLLEGGSVGAFVGGWLEHFLNRGGALLLVVGALWITLHLTTGLSVLNFARNALGLNESDDLASDDELEEAFEEDLNANAAIPAPGNVSVPVKKRAARKKKTANGTGDGDGAGEEPAQQISVIAAPGAFQPMIPFQGQYAVPSLRLLKDSEQKGKRLSRGELRENAQRLVEHLLSFQITGEVVDVTQGPVLTTYEFKPSAGIKLSKIAGLQDDLGVVLGTNELRVIAPIPGKTVVGIEVPRASTDVISLKEVLRDGDFMSKKIKLPVALGKTTAGDPVLSDLAAMPHLLVAGATGSGKSVFMNSLIMSFLFRMTPQELRMILVDPKMLEFSVFDGIPHLVAPVITDNKKAIAAMAWAVDEMERRYALMAKTNSKNIESYNSKQRNAAAKLPFLVIIVDELADLMMSGGQEVEVAITRLAQKARAAGIHLVIATQRPSTDVVTGLIKANIPSRLAFKVPSGIDSRTVLDTSGAEGLIGRGDSLIVQPGIPLRRLHGTYVTEDELARTVNYVKGGKNHTKNFIDFAPSLSKASNDE